MTWEPQADGLQQIISILKESQSPDTATQMAVHMVNKRYYISPFPRLSTLLTLILLFVFIKLKKKTET